MRWKESSREPSHSTSTSCWHAGGILSAACTKRTRRSPVMTGMHGGDAAPVGGGGAQERDSPTLSHAFCEAGQTSMRVVCLPCLAHYYRPRAVSTRASSSKLKKRGVPRPGAYSRCAAQDARNARSVTHWSRALSALALRARTSRRPAHMLFR